MSLPIRTACRVIRAPPAAQALRHGRWMATTSTPEFSSTRDTVVRGKTSRFTCSKPTKGIGSPHSLNITRDAREFKGGGTHSQKIAVP
ncbi:hypothetical protein VDGL01_02076 [Verticillium dahliae]